MIKHTVMYFALEPGDVFDEDFYRDVQVRDALSFVGTYGCRRLELSKRIDVPDRAGRQETFYRSMEMWFDTVEDGIRCIYSPEMLALDERFRDPTRFRRKVAVLVGEVDAFTFAPDGSLASAEGPWADALADLLPGGEASRG